MNRAYLYFIIIAAAAVTVAVCCIQVCCVLALVAVCYCVWARSVQRYVTTTTYVWSRWSIWANSAIQLGKNVYGSMAIMRCIKNGACVCVCVRGNRNIHVGNEEKNQQKNS